MRQGISLALAVAVVSGIALTVDVASGQGHYYGMPHSIEVKFEPAYVNVGDTVKVIATFAPCVDIESLQVEVWLPLKARVDSSSSVIRGWREKVRKDEAIAFSGSAVFPEPGIYKVQVGYWHLDPRLRASGRGEVRSFYFLFPGGVPAARPEEKRPIRMDAAPPGGRGAYARESVRPPAQTGMGSARDSTFRKCRGEAGGDSITTAFVAESNLGGTVWVATYTIPIIATCEKGPYCMKHPLYPEFCLDMEWGVNPPWMGEALEQADHSCVFRAGPTGGLCALGATGIDGITYAWRFEIIANYQLNGTFLYETYSGDELPWSWTLARLYTADPASNDRVMICGETLNHYRLVDSTYTDSTGYYEFRNVNVDSIFVELITKCPSHEVGYSSDGVNWGYYWSGFCDNSPEWWMYWDEPVYPAGFLAAWLYTGAMNIQSLVYTGVNYVLGLPDSYFPEKLMFWWGPYETDPDTTYYMSPGIVVGGETYDLVKVSGHGFDSDEWDEDVFLHEYGHFVMDNYAAFPVGANDCRAGWNNPSTPECAYAEGWARFCSYACQDDPVYKNLLSLGGYIWIDTELPSADPQGVATEGAVCASLWDILDFPNDEDTFIGETWYHNRDLNAGLWWQKIDPIWHVLREPGDLGIFLAIYVSFSILGGGKDIRLPLLSATSSPPTVSYVLGATCHSPQSRLQTAWLCAPGERLIL